MHKARNAVLLCCGVALGGCLPAQAEPNPKRVKTKRGFQPPTRAVQLKALGDLDGVSTELRRALEDDGAFKSIPAPGADDWLAQHNERGQSFVRFKASKPNIPDPKGRYVIDLQPLGDLASSGVPVASLAAYASAFFGLEVRTLPAVAVSKVKAGARINAHTEKKQLYTRTILKHLKKHLRKDSYCLVGLTSDDLYPDPAWNFVFGEATFRDRVGVYSFARYSPQFYGEPRDAQTDALIAARSARVMVHEIGHMFGLEHCTHYACVMNGSNHLGESDSQPRHLCPVCLRKLHHSVGFDPVTRYTNILKASETLGLDDDVRWLKARLAALKRAKP